MSGANFVSGISDWEMFQNIATCQVCNFPRSMSSGWRCIPRLWFGYMLVKNLIHQQHVDQSRRHVQFRALRPDNCWKNLKLRSNYLFSRRYTRQKWLWSVPECLHMCLQCFFISELSLNLYPRSLWFGYTVCLWIGRHVAISWTSSQQLLEAFKKQCFDFKDMILGKSG